MKSTGIFEKVFPKQIKACIIILMKKSRKITAASENERRRSMKKNVWQCKKCGHQQDLSTRKCESCGASLYFHGVALTVNVRDPDDNDDGTGESAEEVRIREEAMQSRLAFFRKRDEAESSRIRRAEELRRGFSDDLRERERELKRRAEYFAKREKPDSK